MYIEPMRREQRKTVPGRSAPGMPEQMPELAETVMAEVNMFFLQTDRIQRGARDIDEVRESRDGLMRSEIASRSKFALEQWDGGLYHMYQDGQERWLQHADDAFDNPDRIRRVSRKVHSPPLTAEQYRDHLLRLDTTWKHRVNEDVVMLWDFGHMVCDGAGSRNRGTAGLMGRICGAVGADQLKRLDVHEADEKTVQETLRRIPTIAGELARTALETNKMTKTAMDRASDDQYHMSHIDFATTLDLYYYARHLDQGFILHVGDGRNYAEYPDGTVVLLSKDHEEPTASGISALTSVVSPRSRPDYIDVIPVHPVPGTRIWSVTDGCFNTHEEHLPDVPFITVVEDAARTAPGKRAKRLVEYAHHEQLIMDWFDDASAIVTTAPANIR